MTEPTTQSDVKVREIQKLAKTDNWQEAVKTYYDTWSECYDKDLADSTYEAPELCAQALANVIVDKNDPIVDCASGTGISGQHLAKIGFKRIDAVDFSQKSLDISASKGVYERLICDKLGANKVKGIEDGYYSGLVCCGGLGYGHITHEVFPEFNRIVKQGGFLCFTFSTKDTNNDEGAKIDTKQKLKAIDDLIKMGIWELIRKVDVSYFSSHRTGLYTVRLL